MVELHNRNGEIIWINLDQVFEVKRRGARTVLKAKLQYGIVEFEVLESFEHVSRLYRSAPPLEACDIGGQL